MIHNGKLLLASCLIVNAQRELLLLYRPEHTHWETPGGRVEETDCTNVSSPTIDDFARAAIREGKEELGDVSFGVPDLFVRVPFKIPSGQEAVAYKFLMRIERGTPAIQEPERFNKLEYLPIAHLQKYPLAPDFAHFLKALQERYK